MGAETPKNSEGLAQLQRTGEERQLTGQVEGFTE